MMLTNKKIIRNQPEETKQRLYRFFYHTISEFSFPYPLYILLLVIQTLQILYYVVHPAYKTLWTLDLIKYIQDITGFIALIKIYEEGQGIGALIMGIIFIIIYFTGIAILIQDIFSTQKKAVTQLTSLDQRRMNLIKLKYTHFLYVLSKTIFTIPVTSLSIAWAHKLNQFSDEKQYLVILLIIISILAFLAYIVILTIFLWFGIDFSPSSKLPISGRLSHNQAIKNIIKISMGIFSGLAAGFSESQYLWVFQIFITVIFFYLCFNACFQVYIENKEYMIVLTNKIYVHLNVTIFWLSLCVLLNQLIVPQNNLTLFFVSLGGILINFLWRALKKLYEQSLIFSEYDSLIDPKQIINYNILCISYIHQLPNSSSSRLKLEGILSSHILGCRKYEFSCKCLGIKEQIHDFHNKHQSFLLSKSFTSNYPDAKISDRDMGAEVLKVVKKQEETLWFEFIINLMKQKLDNENSLNPQLFIYVSLLQRLVSNHCMRALKLLEKMNYLFSGNNKQTRIQFLQYLEAREIENITKEEDERINEKSFINLNKFYEFELGLDQFIDKIRECCFEYLQFWSVQEKTRNKPYNNNIAIAYDIYSKNIEIREMFKELSSKNSHNLFLLELYGAYCEIILNDPRKSLEIKTKMIKINKQTERSPKFANNELEKDKFSTNSNTVIIGISGQRQNLGVIKFCTEKVSISYGYAKHQLMGQSINMIMPPSVSNAHNDILLNFMERQNVFRIFQTIIPVRSKNNFLVASKVSFKLIPNLLNGLQFVGLMNQLKDEHPRYKQTPKYVMYRVDTGKIEVVSQNFYQQYGYQIQQVSQYSQIKEQLQFRNIFKLEDHNSEEYLSKSDENSKGLQVTIKGKDCDTSQNVVLFQKSQTKIFGVEIRIVMILNQKFNKNILKSETNPFEELENKNYNPVNQETVALGLSSKTEDKNYLQQHLAKFIKNEKNFTPGKLRILNIFIILQSTALILFILYKAISEATIISHKSQYLNFTAQSSKSIDHVIQLSYFTRLLHISARQQGDLVYEELRNNVTEIGMSLQNQELWLVNNQPLLEQKGLQFLNSNQKILHWQISESGEVYSTQSAISLSVFDLVTSSSTFNSMPSKKMEYTLKLLQAQSQDFRLDSLQSEFHIRYTTLFQLLNQKFKYFDQVNNLIGSEYEGIRSASLYIFISLSLYSLVMLVIIFSYVIKILKYVQQSQLLLRLVKRTDLENQIRICSCFLSFYFSSSYQLIVRTKFDLKAGESFDEKMYLGSNIEKLLRTQTALQESNKTIEYVSKRNILPNQESFDHKQQFNEYMKNSLPEGQNLQEDFNRRRSYVGTQVDHDQSTFLLSENEDNVANNKAFKESKITIMLILVAFNFYIYSYFIGFFIQSSFHVDNLQNNLHEDAIIKSNILYLKAFKLYALQSTLDNRAFQNYNLLSENFKNYTDKIYYAQQQFDNISRNGQSTTELGQCIFELNTESICQDQFSDQILSYPFQSLSVTQCESIEESILKEGLRISIVTYIEKTLREMKEGEQIRVSTLEELLQLQKYIINALSKAQRIGLEYHSLFLQRWSKGICTTSIVLLLVSMIAVICLYSKISGIVMKKVKGSIQLIKMIPIKTQNQNSKKLDECYGIIDKMLD